MTNPTPRDRLRGVLLGTAVGDSLGLPAEGISPRRAQKLYGGRWRHRLVLNRGMLSDDTEHTLFVAQSLLAYPNSPERFARRLAWCLRGWLLTLPAGVGFATLRSILRLWVGFPPRKSGVFSAGNGPAMRSAPIGAFFALRSQEMGQMDAYLEASTRLTHTDPRALTGAKAVAYLTAWALREGGAGRRGPSVDELQQVLRHAGAEDPEWFGLVADMGEAWAQGHSVAQWARSLGLGGGVTGYIYHTVPVAVYAWLRHFGDFETTLTQVLNCGGDTDTSGAIAGALAGAVVGEEGIPVGWIRGISDWPRTTALLAAVADRLAEVSRSPEGGSPVSYFWPGVLPRNAFFLAVVLLHGLRRLAPPY